MSFAEKEQRLRQYFIDMGLEGWGDTTHQPNERELKTCILNVGNIHSALKKMKEQLDNNAEIRRWKEAVLQLSQTQQPIEDRDYRRWMVRAYDDYLLTIYDIKYMREWWSISKLSDTLQKLGPFLSDPQNDPMRHMTIDTTLRCLELIEEILQPIRDFKRLWTDLRGADSLVNINTGDIPSIGHEQPAAAAGAIGADAPGANINNICKVISIKQSVYSTRTEH